MKTRWFAVPYILSVILAVAVALSIRYRVTPFLSVSNDTDAPIRVGLSLATDTYIIERWYKDVQIFSAAKTAADRGVPVVAYDRLIQRAPLAAYVSFDSEEVGRLFSKALSQSVPSGNYLFVNGSVHNHNSYLIRNGLFEVLKPMYVVKALVLLFAVFYDIYTRRKAGLA